MAERSLPRFSTVAFLTLFLIVLNAVVASGGALATEAETHPCFTICEEEVPPASPTILVVNVGWETGQAPTSVPVVQGGAKAYADYLTGPVNDYFSESAPGIFRPWKVTAAGDFTVSAPPQSTAPICNAEAWFPELRRRAESAATSAGLDLGNYNIVAVTWARPFCGVNGAHEGRVIGLGAKGNTPMHELGHHFGLSHAHTRECFGPNGPITAVTLSNDCKVDDTGDPYDPMGRGRGPFNAISANALGWLNDQFYSVAASTSTSTFTLKPYAELPHGMRAVRLRDGANTLWIEDRQPVGLDAGALEGLSPGLVVHLEVVSGGAAESQLLDMTPDTRFFGDAAMPLGSTWANPLGTMRITYSGNAASGATVTISPQQISVPNLRSNTLTQARAAIEAVGLQYGGMGFVKDSTCEFINVVKSQTPAAGTRVFPGASVSVSIGQEDPKHPCR